MRVVILQHISCESPGIYEEILVEKGASLFRVELDEGQQLPDWKQFDAIIAMGGPMSVNDDGTIPWLTAEKRWVREAVLTNQPYWGVCLGSQLLAASLGARVYPGSKPEVGIMPVYLTGEAQNNAVFSGLPPEILTFQWHGETFDLPEGAVLLATSPLYPNQAFRWKRKAYGVQFHLEISSDSVKQWSQVPTYQAALEQVLGVGAATKVAGDVMRQEKVLNAYARSLFENWLEASAP